MLSIAHPEDYFVLERVFRHLLYEFQISPELQWVEFNRFENLIQNSKYQGYFHLHDANTSISSAGHIKKLFLISPIKNLLTSEIRDWEANGFQFLGTGHLYNFFVHLDTYREPLSRLINANPTPLNYKEKITPVLLIHPKRFDLAIKLLFGQIFANFGEHEWINRLYSRHIFIITGKTTPVREAGNQPPKIGYNAFITAFESLIKDKSGVRESIPVLQNGVIQNGAHRVAASIVNKKKIPIEISKKDRGVNSSFQIYKKSWKNIRGIKRTLMDFSALTLVKEALDLQIIIIFPLSKSKSQINKDINENLHVIYCNSYKLFHKAQTKLIDTLYFHQKKAASDTSEWKNSVEKLRKDRFNYKRNISLYVIQPRYASEVAEFKTCLRTKYGLSNGSIHSTDSLYEVTSISELLFHRTNTFINRFDISSGIEEMLANLKVLSERLGSPENLCVVGGSVLQVLGIRQARDLDIVVNTQFINGSQDFADFKGLDIHNLYFEEYGFNINELLSNPKYYFKVEGFKFLSPTTLLKFKLLRRNKKDFFDIKSIAIVLMKALLGELLHRCKSLLVSPRRYKAYLRNRD
jgi:hypothetical protein